MSTDMERKLVVTVLEFLEDEDEDEDEGGLGSVVLCCAAVLGSMPRVTLPQPRQRQVGYVPHVVQNFRLDEFKTFFRLSRISVQCRQDWIGRVCAEQNVSGILDREGTGGSPQTPLGDRILMLLWYMASLDKYASVADRSGVSESTACCAIRNLLLFIQEYLLEKLIVWPTPAEQEEIKDMYMELRRFPGVVGMVDGSHIPIRQPPTRGIDYYNRKEFYSVVLQGVVREDMRFTHVYAGWPGKVHAARIFRQSNLSESGPPLCGTGHILGDSAYPNLPFLLVPFRDNGHLTPAQTKYNKVHSSIRCTVERAFGLLKGRFIRLQHVDQRDIKTIVSTILTGCVLHNICVLNQDGFEEVLSEDSVPQLQPNVLNFDQNAQEEALRKRLDIARRL